jgi:hypothetical protein
MNIEFHMMRESWLISPIILPASNIHLSNIYWALSSFSDCRWFPLWCWTWWKSSNKGCNNDWWKNSVQKLPNLSDAHTKSMPTRALLYLIPAARSSRPATIFWFFWNWWDFGRRCEEKVIDKSYIFGEHGLI